MFSDIYLSFIRIRAGGRSAHVEITENRGGEVVVASASRTSSAENKRASEGMAETRDLVLDKTVRVEIVGEKVAGKKRDAVPIQNGLDDKPQVVQDDDLPEVAQVVPHSFQVFFQHDPRAATLLLGEEGLVQQLLKLRGGEA